MSLLRRGWVRTFLAVFLACLLGMVVVNAAGGYAHPVYFVGLGIAAGATVAGIQVGTTRIDTWGWPEPETTTPQLRRLGGDDRALKHQYGLARENPRARAAAVGPVLAELTAERLSLRYGVGPDEAFHRAEEWVSPALVGLIDGSGGTLTLDEFDELMKEIETL